MERADTEFQGLCLVNAAGSQTIEAYDGLPSEVRAIVRDAPYNLCPACLSEIAHNISRKEWNPIAAPPKKSRLLFWRKDPAPRLSMPPSITTAHYEEAIRQMEAKLNEANE